MEDIADSNDCPPRRRHAYPRQRDRSVASSTASERFASCQYDTILIWWISSDTVLEPA